ncbi:glycosyl hydrolase BNR repeat-containing protein [Fimbriimonas ginsengisoli Gsoil 348]|uniref:Glycosyl hydrolase BNR repeat-containing protein n=1 Tax=Fimbriimonas ginsengisoli Gsoil 348 TaxID=661478 RepID=A0A068NN00_FIMGI|nr:glycosyl hydrolase BNR repeat-containing protein [Fimbriimonas ginsengisoli Gsoil 348]
MSALAVVCLVSFTTRAFAQADPDEAAGQEGNQRLTKAQERQKFHPYPVKGMPAAERMRAYQQRLDLEAQSPFGGLNWHNIGPEVQGGRVLDIKSPKDDPRQLFVAYATGGLWKTVDDGTTWTSLFDGQSAFGIGSFALSHDGKTIWVGSGEANNQRTSYSGTGIFKSTDGGKTWTNMGLPESHHISQVIINPKNENVVYVAAMGHLYSQNPERGIYKTTDGGKTWEQILKVDEYTGGTDIVMDPRNPEILTAAMYDRDRRAWNFRESGPGSGVFRSINGGKIWSKITTLPSGDAAGRIALAQAPSNPSRMYAFVDNQAVDPRDWEGMDERVPSGRLTARRFLNLNDDLIVQLDPSILNAFLRQATNGEVKAEDVIKDIKEKKSTFQQLKDRLKDKYPATFDPGTTGEELYRSDDGGKTWSKAMTGNFGTIGGYYYDRVFVNPTNADEVFVTGLPLLRSVDAGKTWEYVFRKAHVDFHAAWFDPRDTSKVWAGNDGGLYLSYDSGKTVKPINNLGVGQATTIAVDNKRPYNVYIGLQDNGTMRGPSSYVPGQSDPNQWKSIFGGDGSAVAVDPRNDGDVVYVAYQFGEHSAINQATNERWRARPAPPKGDPDARFNWISPIFISTHHPDIVYCGAQRLYRSFNQGRNYTPISPDLTKNKPNGDVPYSTIKDISESPFQFGLIYVGCDDGNVQMTADGGATWKAIPTPQHDKWVSRVVASKYDANTVYVSQNGYREDDFSPYLWKSTDRGRTWRSIVGNLPAEPINVIREDPGRKDLLYVGTDMGVYVSYDGGVVWEALQGGLPHTPVHDIAIQPRENEMVIATHARSVWALPLKLVWDLTPELRKKDLTLFEVDNAIRLSTWGYDRRERWNTEPPKPPTVKVNFYTKEPGKAFIRIKDKAGKLVKEKSFDALRGYNFGEIDLQISPGNPAAPRKEVKTVQDVLADPLASTRPTYIAAGEYTLELQVGDKTVSQAWKVRE